jgi:hypothetical protein
MSADWTSYWRSDSTVVERSPDGTIDPPLETLTITGNEIESFASWLKMPRPILNGDHVIGGTGRHRSDVGVVRGLWDDRAWVHWIWDTSSEHEIEPLNTLRYVVPEKVAEVRAKLRGRG